MSSYRYRPLLRAQGDVNTAVNIIVSHNLPLDTAGAEACEQHLRDFDEGFREMWKHPHYLRQTVYMAQAIVECVREGDKYHRSRSRKRMR
jgi:hypothetical protein